MSDIKETNNGAKFSFEFFPPRTPRGEEKLREVHRQLAQLNPEFFSVTYGAGGSTRSGTKQAVMHINSTGSTVAPHLFFGGSTKEEIILLLDEYKQAGINRLVVLRGDIPSGTGTVGQYYYANELITFIREATGNYFHIEVACYPEVHPQSVNFDSELSYFKQKVDAGANSAITQYFYNLDAYCYFIDACRKKNIDLPIVPGIMPITNFTNLVRFSDSCGAEIPRWIRQRLQSYGDDVKSIKAFGIDVVTNLCAKLLQEGAPGLHFYTMNQSDSVKQIWNNLNLSEK